MVQGLLTSAPFDAAPVSSVAIAWVIPTLNAMMLDIDGSTMYDGEERSLGMRECARL
jgi:hypothetical protein